MACNQTLNGLQASCDSSKGGILKVWMAPYDKVTAISADTAGTITAVTLTGDTQWAEYNFKRGTGSMTSTLNVDDANGVNYVSTDLVLQFNKMDTTKRIEMTALALSEVIVVVKDANNKYWLLGKDGPVSASAGTAQTGQARTDGNMYQITLQANDDTYPFEAAASIVEGE